MKRYILILLAVFLWVSGLAALSFAQADESYSSTAESDEAGYLRGRVVSVDEAKGEIVISPLSGGEDKTFTFAAGQQGGLEVGQTVRVKYDPATMAVQSINRTMFRQGRWFLYGQDPH